MKYNWNSGKGTQGTAGERDTTVVSDTENRISY